MCCCSSFVVGVSRGFEATSPAWLSCVVGRATVPGNVVSSADFDCSVGATFNSATKSISPCRACWSVANWYVHKHMISTATANASVSNRFRITIHLRGREVGIPFAKRGWAQNVSGLFWRVSRPDVHGDQATTSIIRHRMSRRIRPVSTRSVGPTLNWRPTVIHPTTTCRERQTKQANRIVTYHG